MSMGWFPIFAKSVLEKASLPIILTVITAEYSRPIIEGVLSGSKTSKRFHEVSYLNVSAIVEQLKRIVSIISPYFSSEPGTYFSDAMFFCLWDYIIFWNLNLHKVIVADVDMMFVGDIAELWREFNKFNNNSILGIAPELSHTYRTFFREYRDSHPGTVIGEPTSGNGFPGVNSGILLLNLERILRSGIFAKFIGDDIIGNPQDSEEIKKLKEEVNGRVTSVGDFVKKYSFVSGFGDQDFYTLLGAEYPELIHIIPCVWNRQLCTKWAEVHYESKTLHEELPMAPSPRLGPDMGPPSGFTEGSVHLPQQQHSSRRTKGGGINKASLFA
ncbi:xyloside xylosyltransferase 1-like [Hetaerina americana]|uniref:xyloside xylosyltransferase 1-like n=1 Tax=Hetaerina americana TaxID=62018 RepID=UPI003A7F440D